MKDNSFRPAVSAESRSLKNQAALQQLENRVSAYNCSHLTDIRRLEKKINAIVEELTKERTTRRENWTRIIERIEVCERAIGENDGC